MLKHAYADVNGIRLHYASAGQGKLILFVHGFPEFWYAWKDQLAEFGRDHLAVAPDMRGYNLSSKPEAVEQYEVPHMVADLRALAKSLGHEKFTLVAHDWGGGVAWSLAIRHPEWLEKLIIINSPHPATFERELANNPAQQAASQYMLFFRSSKAEAALSANNYAALVDTVMTAGLKKGHFTEADREAYLAAWSQPGALTGGLNWYRAARVGPPTDSEPKARSFEPDVGKQYGEGANPGDLGREGQGAGEGEPGRARAVCARPHGAPHPRRQPLGRARTARRRERPHSRVHRARVVDGWPRIPCLGLGPVEERRSDVFTKARRDLLLIVRENRIPGSRSNSPYENRNQSIACSL